MKKSTRFLAFILLIVMIFSTLTSCLEYKTTTATSTEEEKEENSAQTLPELLASPDNTAANDSAKATFSPVWTDIKYIAYKPDGSIFPLSGDNNYHSYLITTKSHALAAKRRANGSAATYISTTQFDITENTKFEYEVKVHTNSSNRYAGVPFAISPDNRVYFAYGSFDNKNDTNSSYANHSYIITAHGSYTNTSPKVSSTNATNDAKYYQKLQQDDVTYVLNKGNGVTPTITVGFATLKFVYEGLTVKVYAKNTSGKFVQMGYDVTLESGSKLVFGTYSREADNMQNRTVAIAEATITGLNASAVNNMIATGANIVVEKAPETEAPTEKPTEAPTETETEAPTEKPTEAPTEPETEAPTEKPTEAPTETETEAPTKPDTDVTTSLFNSTMAANKDNNDKLLKELLPKYTALRDQIKNKKSGYNFGTATSNIGTKKSSWTAKVPTPSTQHPRLLVTNDTIPTIRKALENKDDPTVARFYELLDYSHPTNGKLGAAQKDFDGRKGLHNYDKQVLELIQIKALAYLVGGHELYGYQAIHYMKQFLRTLNIQYISSDQCREYGNTMFTAALVYDWCYDLLTEEDKRQIIAGVENKTAKGNCGDPSYTSTTHYKYKMEVGFPPSGQGVVSGHGSERQILRDYLSAAVAFYGDNNSWWNYVAARVYSEYVPVRNYYFESGISHQGTGVYASGRHIADMYSAWILLAATGSQPYPNINKTVRNFLGYECAPGIIFSDGDGTYPTQNNYEFRALSYMTAYLFSDEAMLAQAKSMQPKKAFEADTIELTSAMYIALCGMSDIEPAEDKYAGMELLQYNGSPVGQYVTHQAWNSTSSAAVLMRIKERSMANHEHADAGTFMIYYKGMLTADAGVYKGYGSTHTRYYHQATVSHNGLLIFDPSKSDTSSSNAAKKWYSGGQIWPNEAQTFAALKSDTYSTGTVIGNKHGYADAEKTQPLFAYVGGNITAAYDSSTVDFVGRRMLTVYTGDEKVPMAFFVYDSISSDSASFTKKFLLHITSPNAPTIDKTKKTIVTENGDGRLVLTCLTNGVTITGLGGRTSTNGTFNPDKSKNYLINGLQNTIDYDDKTWGRVEISQSGAKTQKFFNVMYVTDKGNTTYYETKPITNVSSNTFSSGDVEGGVFNNSIAAIFSKCNLTKNNCHIGTISFTTPGTSTALRYYVDGMATGQWKVTVNGKDAGTYSVQTTERFLNFTAPAGNVVLTRVSTTP